MSTIAERLLEDAPKRPTVGHVEALVQADEAKKRQDAERAVRAQKRREWLAREAERQRAAAMGERAHESASAGIAAVRRAMEGQD